MCHFKTSWNKNTKNENYFDQINERLSSFAADNLMQITDNELIVTEKGKPFVRNICMAFDLRLNRHKPTTKLFSQTI